MSRLFSYARSVLQEVEILEDRVEHLREPGLLCRVVGEERFIYRERRKTVHEAPSRYRGRHRSDMAKGGVLDEPDLLLADLRAFIAKVT